jgi:hypothetical protein
MRSLRQTPANSTTWRRTRLIKTDHSSARNYLSACVLPLNTAFQRSSIRWLTGLCGYGEKGISPGKPTDG